MSRKPSDIDKNFRPQGQSAVLQVALHLGQYQLQANLSFSPHLLKVKQSSILSAVQPDEASLFTDELNNSARHTEVASPSQRVGFILLLLRCSEQVL